MYGQRVRVSPDPPILINGPLAQSGLERETHNFLVRGSNPLGSTNFEQIMKNYDLMRVRNCLQKLHKGDAISDEDLSDAILYLEDVIYIFEDIGIPSMPEYDVFAKALKNDLNCLVSFMEGRDISS